MSLCPWIPTFCLFLNTTSTFLLLPPYTSSPFFTTLLMSKSLSVLHSIYRFLPRRTGMWCCITAWPPPLRGRRSTLSLSWHLATMCSSIYLLPSWLRASRPRWVIFFPFFFFCWNDNNCATLKDIQTLNVAFHLPAYIAFIGKTAIVQIICSLKGLPSGLL